MRTFFRVTRSTLVTVLLSCSPGGGDAWTGAVSDSAGIRIVANPADPLWGDGEVWTLEEELSIGVSIDRAGADPAYQFADIGGVAVDADGNLYVVEDQAAEVRVFDPAGSHLRTMGGRGEGPGELGDPDGVFVIDGEVVVPDQGNQRINVYSREGEPLRSLPLDFAAGIPNRWDEGPDGQLLAQIHPVFLAEGAEEFTRDRVVVVGDDGTFAATLIELTAGEVMRVVDGQPQRKLLAPVPRWDARADGHFVWGESTEYRLETRDGSGAVTAIITRDVESHPVTDRDKDVFTGALTRRFGERGIPPEAIAEFEASLSFGEFYPVFGELLAGPEGSVWVQRVRTGTDLVGEDGAFDPSAMGSDEWEVFDGDGRYLGVVAFPDRFSPFRTIGDRLYGISLDQFDVQSLKVMRVVR